MWTWLCRTPLRPPPGGGVHAPCPVHEAYVWLALFSALERHQAGTLKFKEMLSRSVFYLGLHCMQPIQNLLHLQFHALDTQ